MRFLALFLCYGLITKHNFITHIYLPCKIKQQLSGNYDKDKCDLFGKIDFFTNHVKYDHVDFSRSIANNNTNINNCHENALYFEEYITKFRL